MSFQGRKRALLPVVAAAVAATVVVAVSLLGGSAEAFPIDDPAPAERERILVRYFPSRSAQIAALEPTLGLRLAFRIGPLSVRVLETSPNGLASALEQLTSTHGVEFAEADGILSASETVPNDPLWARQWAPPRINAPKAWDVTTGSGRIVVAVLDTGVDGSHPELRGKLVAGYDHVNREPDAADDNGHGTAVAGVVAAQTNNSDGVASFCWSCVIMPVKVLSADGSGTNSEVASGIVWAVDEGARILNLSLGGPKRSKAMELAVRYARDKGVVVIAAAGNSASTKPTYPAAFPGVLGVAASDENDRLYSFSNSGPWVPLAAPGTNLAPGLEDTYTSFVGTSSAAPVVAGVAGLALSLDTSAIQVEQAMTETAVPIPGVSAGRVDALATVARFAPPAAPAPSQPSTEIPIAPPGVSPSTTGPSGRLRKVFRGQLTKRRRTRMYSLATGDGRLVAELVVEDNRRVQLRITSATGTVLARGRLRRRGTLRVVVPAGAYRLFVSGRPRTRAAFTLLASYARPG